MTKYKMGTISKKDNTSAVVIADIIDAVAKLKYDPVEEIHLGFKFYEELLAYTKLESLKAQRQEELKNSPQLLLGELILKLEAVNDKEKPLYIDILDKRPKGIASWRGSYCELAIQTESSGSYNTEEVIKEYPEFGMTTYKKKSIGKENPTVSEWLEVLKEAMGKTFEGYKGGDFLMGKNTPVWLAEYGSSSFKIDDKPIDEKNYSNYKSVFFVDVREDEDKVYLITKQESD